MMERAGILVIETGDLAADPIDMVVSYSNARAAKAITLHLAHRGYPPIGFVSHESHTNRRASERQRGYFAALKELGRRKDSLVVLEVRGGLTAGGHALTDLLARAPDVDAIFFAGDVLAIITLFVARPRGWKVPGRVAIAGFDDLEMLQHTMPKVTCLRPRLEIERRSAEALLSRRRGNDEPVQLDVGFQVIQREST